MGDFHQHDTPAQHQATSCVCNNAMCQNGEHFTSCFVRCIMIASQIERSCSRNMISTYRVSLSRSEVRELKAIVAQDEGAISRTIRKRCEVLLALNSMDKRAYPCRAAAEAAGTCTSTVYNTIRLYKEGGIAAVLDYRRNPLQDVARLKADEHVEEALRRLLASPPPPGKERWTLNLLIEALRTQNITISAPTAGRALKRLGLSTFVVGQK